MVDMVDTPASVAGSVRKSGGPLWRPGPRGPATTEPPEAADTDAEVMWPDDDDAWTYEGVAHELGVSFALVRDAILDSIQICISTNLNIPSEREQKRDAVRSFIEEHPDATDVEVAGAVDWDISQPTVNRWRNQMFDDEEDEEDDDDTEQTSLVGAGEDAEDTERDIASDLGVGKNTVHRAIAELRDNGNLVQVDQLSTEEKRDQVREYVAARVN